MRSGRWLCRAAVAGGLGLVVACGDGGYGSRGRGADRGPLEPAVRDSAGVRIVEYGAALPRTDAWRWRVTEEPLTVVGRDPTRPGHALTEVVGVVVLGDGTVVVADGETSEIHLYEPDGSLRATVGGRGEGPGEYRAIQVLHRLDGAPGNPGDEGFVVFGTQRASGDVYDARGERVGAVPLARPDFFARGTEYFRVLSTLGPDTVVLLGETDFMRAPFEDGANRVTHSVGLLTVGEDGAFRMEVLDSLAGSQVAIERMAGGGVRYSGFAFPAFGRVEVGREIWMAATDRWAVDRLAPRGDGRLSIRVDEPRRPVTDADVDDFWEAFPGGRELTDAEATRFRRQIEDAPGADDWPALEDIHADRSGGVWVEDYRLRRREAADLDGFDADGRWRGWLRLPAGYGPRRTVLDPGLFFDGAVLAGVWVDEMDVQEVRVYRIERPEGPGGG